MKSINRGLILCMKHNIESAQELAAKANISVDSAARVINQQELSIDEIKALCLYFKVSAPYLMCITERNNYPELQLDYANI